MESHAFASSSGLIDPNWLMESDDFESSTYRLTEADRLLLMEADDSESSTAHVSKYDVFLSFRGPDTLKGITSELYDRLQNRGIKAFKDDPDLEVGDVISPTLLKAIEESRFAIVVLSTSYADSTWCLEELAKICECMEDHNRILPLFYNVDPGDVRHQQHSFGDTFTKHGRSGRRRSEKVQQWKDALKKVANFSGWDSKPYRVIDNSLKPLWSSSTVEYNLWRSTWGIFKNLKQQDKP